MHISTANIFYSVLPMIDFIFSVVGDDTYNIFENSFFCNIFAYIEYSTLMICYLWFQILLNTLTKTLVNGKKYYDLKKLRKYYSLTFGVPLLIYIIPITTSNYGSMPEKASDKYECILTYTPKIKNSKSLY